MAWLVAGVVGAVLGGLGALLVLRGRRVPPAVEADGHTTRLAEAGRHVAAVAHELNNPLSAILAFAQDMLDADPTPDQRAALRVIQQQARRSRRIVRGLLETLRAPATERQLVDPHELFTRVSLVFQRECTARGQQFELQVADHLPGLAGEAEALEQVLVNLLQNACQATPTGGRVMLTASLRGRLVEFVVQDSGPGIPAEHLDHIFEPFFTTKASSEGTGLGLAVAQAIVARHRGTLVAENVSDGQEGARFVVSLPFVDRRRVDRDPTEGDQTGPQVPAGRRVLMVDDEQGLATALARFLERRGWQVEILTDGEAALARALSAEPDVILCDLNLPGLSGQAIHDRLAAERPALARRMVLMSGNASSGEVQDFVARTGLDILEKPFDLHTLAERLARVETSPTTAR